MSLSHTITHVVDSFVRLYECTHCENFKNTAELIDGWVRIMDEAIKVLWGFKLEDGQRTFTYSLCDTKQNLAWVGDEIWRLEVNLLTIYISTRAHIFLEIANQIAEWQHQLTPQNKQTWGITRGIVPCCVAGEAGW
jgi:hypothetical protein